MFYVGCICRLREKYGVVRVSTAFEFYMALFKHLELATTYTSLKEKYEKPLMGASRYRLFYLASSAEDRAKHDINHVHMTLDRTLMWNCTALKVSSVLHCTYTQVVHFFFLLIMFCVLVL
jgi:hypothetical protein